MSTLRNAPDRQVATNIRTDQRRSSRGLKRRALAHWLLAIFIAILLGSGFAFDALDDAGFRFHGAVWHKSIGATLLLIFVPILAVVTFGRPNSAVGLTHNQRVPQRLVRAYHLTLFALIAGMLASGWVASNMAAVSAPAWIGGLVLLPDIRQLLDLPDVVTADNVGWVHSCLAWVLVLGIAGHVVAALFHAWKDRDFFNHIWPWHRAHCYWPATPHLVVAGLLLLALASAGWTLSGVQEGHTSDLRGPKGRLLPSEVPHPSDQNTLPETAVAGQPPTTDVELQFGDQSEDGAKATEELWVVVPSSRKLSATVEAFGQPVVASFADWSANFLGTPDRPEAASVDVLVDVSRLATGSAEIDTLARGEAVLDTARSRTARLACKGPRQIAAGRFVCRAELTLRQTTREVTVHFEMTNLAADKVRIEGRFVFEPTSFGIDIPANQADRTTANVDFALTIERAAAP